MFDQPEIHFYRFVQALSYFSAMPSSLASFARTPSPRATAPACAAVHALSTRRAGLLEGPTGHVTTVSPVDTVIGSTRDILAGCQREA
jgi:hypothetical protein